MDYFEIFVTIALKGA